MPNNKKGTEEKAERKEKYCLIFQQDINRYKVTVAFCNWYEAC